MTSEQIDDLGDVLLGNIPVHRKEGEIVIDVRIFIENTSPVCYAKTMFCGTHRN